MGLLEYLEAAFFQKRKKIVGKNTKWNSCSTKVLTIYDMMYMTIYVNWSSSNILLISMTLFLGERE